MRKTLKSVEAELEVAKKIIASQVVELRATQNEYLSERGNAKAMKLDIQSSHDSARHHQKEADHFKKLANQRFNETIDLKDRLDHQVMISVVSIVIAVILGLLWILCF